jgi:hypothetical protein
LFYIRSKSKVEVRLDGNKKLGLSGARHTDVTGFGVPEHHGDGSALCYAPPSFDMLTDPQVR